MYKHIRTNIYSYIARLFYYIHISFIIVTFDDDDDVYLYKLQREGVTKSILYTLSYRPAKKAVVQSNTNDNKVERIYSNFTIIIIYR
jgi:hypothetical protein